MRTRAKNGDRFGAVRAAALAQIETFAAKLLPDGKRAGDRWVSRVPWRDDRKPSLCLWFNTGWWQDHGTGDKGGPIDLVMRLDGCDKMKALETLEGELGLDATQQRFARPEPPKCSTCAHCWRRYDDDHVKGRAGAYCTRLTLDDEPMPVASARRARECGAMGKLHELYQSAKN